MKEVVQKFHGLAKLLRLSSQELRQREELSGLLLNSINRYQYIKMCLCKMVVNYFCLMKHSRC